MVGRETGARSGGEEGRGFRPRARAPNRRRRAPSERKKRFPSGALSRPHTLPHPHPQTFRHLLQVEAAQDAAPEAAVAGAPSASLAAAPAPAGGLSLASLVDPKSIQSAVDAQLKMLADNPAAAQSFLQTTAASAGLVEGVPAASDADVATANANVLATAPRLSGAMQTINEEMRFPHPDDGPTPEYIVSKVEDKVQERAPLVANKVLKLANDAYTHVDFNKLVDRMLVLKQEGAALGHWPGPNPYGFAPDDENFCIFAVPALRGAPQAFKQAAAASPLGLPKDFKGPAGDVFAKLGKDAKPTVPTAADAKSALASLAAKFPGLPGFGAGAAASKAAPAGTKLPGYEPDALKSVAMGSSLALDRDASFGKADASGVPDVRTFAADGKDWACTPFEPASRDPKALAMAAGVTAPAPSTRRLMQAAAAASAAAAATADADAEAAIRAEIASMEAATDASAAVPAAADATAAATAAAVKDEAASVLDGAAGAADAAAATGAAAASAVDAAAAAVAPASGSLAVSGGMPAKPSMEDTINPAGGKIVDPSALLGVPNSATPALINPLTGENKFASSEELSDAVAEQSAGAYSRLMDRVQSGAADDDEFAKEALADLGDRTALTQLNSFVSLTGVNASLASTLAAKNASFVAALAAKNATLAEALASKNATLVAALGGSDALLTQIKSTLSNKNATLRDLLKKPDPKRPPLVTFDPATGVARVHPPKSAIDALGVKFDQVVRGETGDPFFDCIGVKDAPSGKVWLATAASDAETLTKNLVSFLKTASASGKGAPVPTGFAIKNPFDANGAPINVQFSQTSPFTKLPNGESLGDNPWAAAKAFIDAAPKPPRLGAKPAAPPAPDAAAKSAASKTPAATSANFGGHDWQDEAAKMAADAEAARAAAASAARAADAASRAAAMLPVDADGAPTLNGVAYDGYVSDCALVIGGAPRMDGTFDKVDGFLTTVKGGRFGVPAAILADHPGSVAYVVPAARGRSYAAVGSPSDAPGFCFDRATLQPVFNPLATPLPTTEAGMAKPPSASPLSSLLVFGKAAGLTPKLMAAAFGLADTIDVPTHDALAAVLSEANPSGPAMTAVRANAAIANTVTMGASLLAGDTPAYANAAVLTYAALAEAAVSAAKKAGVDDSVEAPAPSPASADEDTKEAASADETADAAAADKGSRRRRLAQADDADAPPAPRRSGPPLRRAGDRVPPPRPAPLPLPSLPLIGPAVPGAARAAPVAAAPAGDAAAEETTSSSTTPNPVEGAALNLADSTVIASIFARAQALAAATAPGTPPPAVDASVAKAAAGAVASLNAEAGAAKNPADTQKTTYVAQAQLVPAVGRLAAGTVPADAFAAAASPDGVRASLATASLPGVLDAAPLASPAQKGGLSKGGAIAVGVIVPVVLLAGAAAAAVVLSRRRRAPAGTVRG